MKHIVFLFIFLTCAPLCAQQEARKTAYFLPRLEITKIANLGPGCRIRLKLPNKAELGTHYESEEHPGTGGIGISGLPTSADRWGMSLQCHKSSEAYVASGWATKKMDKWELNENEATVELIHLDALNFYNLKAKNSEGWAVTMTTHTAKTISVKGRWHIAS